MRLSWIPFAPRCQERSKVKVSQTYKSFIHFFVHKKWACTSVLWWPWLAPSAEGMTEGCWPSDSLERRTLSNESIEEAELTETPEAEVTEEREEWTIERA